MVTQNFSLSAPIRPVSKLQTGPSLSTKKTPTPSQKTWTKNILICNIGKNRKVIQKEQLPIKLNEISANFTSVTQKIEEVYNSKYVLIDSKKLRISDNQMIKDVFYFCFNKFGLVIYEVLFLRKSLLVRDQNHNGRAYFRV
jgi:hypothetical protein